MALRSYGMGPKELRDAQNRSLRKTIRHAFSYVPYYRKLFRDKGWTPQEFRTVDDLRRLPILSREEVIKNYPDGLVARGMKSQLVRVTSGTSGLPVRVAFSSEYMDVKEALTIRRFVKLGIRPWHRVVTVWDPPWRWRKLELEGGKTKKTTQLHETPFATFLDRPIPPIKVMPGGVEDVYGEARKIYELNPDYVFCRPTRLRRIARALTELGLEIRPKGLICTNEVLTATCAKELESKFGARTLRFFGGSEAGPMGQDCRFKTGVHLNQDHFVIEVLKDGEAVSPGEMGEVVVTHLHNPVMPLMRYRMGDFVEMGEEGTCACGSNLPRLKSIQGRVEDRLLALDGSRVPPLAVADHVESALGLRDFQIVQVEPSRFRLRVTGSSGVDSTTVTRLQSYLGELVGSPVVVSTETRPAHEQWLKQRPVTCSLNQ